MTPPKEPNRKPTGDRSPDEVARMIQQVKDFEKRTKGMSLDQFLGELEELRERDSK